jgi:hypothetical protein
VGKLPISAREKPQFRHFWTPLHLSNNGVFCMKIAHFTSNPFGLVGKIAKQRAGNRESFGFYDSARLHREIGPSQTRCTFRELCYLLRIGNSFAELLRRSGSFSDFRGRTNV